MKEEARPSGAAVSRATDQGLSKPTKSADEIDIVGEYEEKSSPVQEGNESDINDDGDDDNNDDDEEDEDDDNLRIIDN